MFHYIGLSDVPGEAMVKLYCPKCQDVYLPKSSRHHHTDGAYFGTGFPHMLFMVHPEYRPKRPVNQFIARSDFLFCLSPEGSSVATNVVLLFFFLFRNVKMGSAHFRSTFSEGFTYQHKTFLFTFSISVKNFHFQRATCQGIWSQMSV